MKPFTDPAAAAHFAGYPQDVREKMLALRALIFSVAAATNGVGTLLETLKWGEPAYTPLKKKTGSTVRIDWKAKNPAQYAIYFNCNTTLVDTFRTLFPDDFKFEGNRAIVFDLNEKIDQNALSICIAASLTYHASKTAKADSPRNHRHSRERGNLGL